MVGGVFGDGFGGFDGGEHGHLLCPAWLGVPSIQPVLSMLCGIITQPRGKSKKKTDKMQKNLAGGGNLG
jgi:hypothetical protein